MPVLGDEMYNEWMKNRSGKGGVVRLTKKSIPLRRVVINENKSEAMHVEVEKGNVEMMIMFHL